MDLIERLRSAAEAYPEDVFGKTTSGDRLQHGDVVQRAAATMGRHMAPLLTEAAAALEAARAEREVIVAEAVKYADKSGRLEAKVDRLAAMLSLADALRDHEQEVGDG